MVRPLPRPARAPSFRMLSRAPMITALLLLAGALLMVADQALALVAGVPGSPGGGRWALALGLAAIGLWTLRDEKSLDRTGRVGVAMTSFGLASMATVALMAMGAGGPSEAEIAPTPFYLMALVFLVAGLLGFALQTWRAPALPRALAALPAGLALLHLLRPFLAGADLVVAAANLGLGLALLGLAAVLLRRRFGKTAP